MSEISFVYTTIDDQKKAKKVAKQIIEEKLAACVNVLPKVNSFYFYKNKVHTNEEFILLIKTQKKLFPWLKEFLSKHHPYDCPCIAEIKIESINEVFSSWILKETNLK
jgi:periplasmic divalent cation tolerance protein